MRYVGLVLVAIAVLLSLAASSPASSTGHKLPDLVPIPKYLKNHLIETGPNGTRTLRFANGIGNYGPGPLEVFGERSSSSQPMTAFQRVYDDQGNVVSELATGEFVFDIGDGHNHWHFLDMVEYRLYPQGQPSNVVKSFKAGFCLLDVDRIKPAPAGASASAYYIQCNQGNSSAQSVGPQGVSVGWIDVYGKFISGQSIDITGLAPGRYVLESRVDPSLRLAETNDGNNTASVVISIR